MKLTRRQRGRNGIELAEEAVHLLRMNSSALPAYYFGSLPFILGLLYFWTDMSRSPYASQHLPAMSLGLALLFVWMKFWHCVFANILRARIAVDAPPRWTVRRALRVLLVQTAIQPSALILVPLAILPAALPFGSVYAFYQNVTALTDGDSGEIRKTIRRASRQATIWAGQNHLALFTMLVFGFYVFLNVASVAFMSPLLAKTFFGIESVYTRSPMSLLNSTLFASIYAITYLCVDPILKAIYVLRCFYGVALDSGEDLKAELKQFHAPVRSAIALAMIFIGVTFALPSRADDNSASPQPAPIASVKNAPPAAMSPPQLDRAIEDVIRQSKYAWRTPREKPPVDDSEQELAIVRFLRKCCTWVGHQISDFFEWIGKWIDKLFRSRSTPSVPSSSGTDWMEFLHGVYFLVITVAVCALVFLGYKVWQRAQLRVKPILSEAIPTVPDLADEDVGADQLPEDGWVKLGRELLGRGELRLALRAFYFASLNHLATRNLITIAKFKSNRDYERELGRRGHSLPKLLSMFGENVSVFDRSWYGLHEVDAVLVNQFIANVERMKGE